MDSDDVLRAGFVCFPPRRQHVLIPLRPPAAAAFGTTLYTASRRPPLLAQRALWAAARVGGGRLLPGPHTRWHPPMPTATWGRLWQDWTALLGPVEAVAVYTRPQASRPGLVIALWSPGRAVVVRLRTDAAGLDTERQVAEVAPVASFAVPATIGHGFVNDWHWQAARAMTTRPHSPLLVLPVGLLADVAAVVATALRAPDGTPEHWRPAHGDLTPWNLRRAGRRVWLIDWEDAGWAPPGADEIYYAATVGSLAPAPRPVVDLTGPYGEAARWWRERLDRRCTTDADADLTGRLLTALGA